jgi:hypothetical protein
MDVLVRQCWIAAGSIGSYQQCSIPLKTLSGRHPEISVILHRNMSFRLLTAVGDTQQRLPPGGNGTLACEKYRHYPTRLSTIALDISAMPNPVSRCHVPARLPGLAYWRIDGSDTSVRHCCQACSKSSSDPGRYIFGQKQTFQGELNRKDFYF